MTRAELALLQLTVVGILGHTLFVTYVIFRMMFVPCF